MAMRIWHQSMAVLRDVPEYTAALSKRLPTIVRPDTEVVMHGLAVGTMDHANYPKADLASAYLMYAHGNQFIAAGLDAQAQGFDAMVLATLGNPMLHEIRSLVDIPVVGYGDVSFRLAALYGKRFGLMFFNTVREGFWREYFRVNGLSEAFAGIVPAGVSFQDVVAAHADDKKRDEVIGQIRVTGERMVSELGVNVIVPGEMPLNLLLANAKVAEIAGATVIDGLALSFKTAEMMVDLRRTTGMIQSRAGWGHAKPDAGRLAQVQQFYGLDKLRGRLSTE
jgi:Asp/Glu/hydantoin racemase